MYRRGTHVAKLDEAQLAELGHTVVRGFRLQEELAQAHLLAAVERPHFLSLSFTSTSFSPLLLQVLYLK
jgi:hypothetical protein